MIKTVSSVLKKRTGDLKALGVRREGLGEKDEDKIDPFRLVL